MAEPKVSEGVNFTSFRNKPIQLEQIGYHDLREIEPIEFFRIQDGYTIHYVRNGRGFLEIGEKKYSIGAGDLFFVPPGIKMKYYPDSSEPWRYFWFFLGESEAPLANSLGLTVEKPVTRVSSPIKIEHEFDELFSEKLTLDKLYYKALSVLMILVADTISPTSKGTISEGKRNIAQNIRDIIDLNFKNADFSVDVIPDALFISHSYMCRKFKEEYGISPVSYLLDLRLSFAAGHIGGERTIRELSAMCGFSDEFYFMRRFKAKYKMTVREYQKQMQ